MASVFPLADLNASVKSDPRPGSRSDSWVDTIIKGDCVSALEA
ncbi:modification methylase, partial [Rhizobium ruizarguesonis]